MPGASTMARDLIAAPDGGDHEMLRVPKIYYQRLHRAGQLTKYCTCKSHNVRSTHDERKSLWHDENCTSLKTIVSLDVVSRLVPGLPMKCHAIDERCVDLPLTGHTDISA